MFLFGMLLFIFFQNLYNVLLLIISQDQVYGVIFVQLSFVCLYITSGCNNNGIRIHLFRLMEHLSGFTVCNIGNCTCIYQINISSWLKRHDLISCLFQQLLHCFYFICVDFTA